ncbi:hypothetical protein GCM10025867_46770 (plasmid) [Frondihabitans sucicola]|uniref:KaiC-like domain-containing protein n=1 Tax=Frondihabitans sucicola TaxID=1268041 RepID=A0ABN6Y5M7_9MICO|nr:hypothetical protein [Frondihabitans sucicola]BDZ52436.1 hypothetical protein GCM10025867_46770 [Frondihabitans sucicola]
MGVDRGRRRQGALPGLHRRRRLPGAAQRGVPVFYDLQNIGDDAHQAPTEIVFGDPGSGKTVSRGLKCALEDGYKGITQFIWDPKETSCP